MAFLTMISTIPFLYLTLKYCHDVESFFKLKIFSIWLLCQIYLWLNNKHRIPLGIIVAFLVIANTRLNKRSKVVAFIIGILSFGMSIGVHMLSQV